MLVIRKVKLIHLVLSAVAVAAVVVDLNLSYGFQKYYIVCFVFFLKPIKPVPKNPIQFEQEKFDREFLDKRRQKLVEGAPITSRQERVLKSALKNSCFSHDNEALNNYRLITGKDFISFVLCYGSILIKS